MKEEKKEGKFVGITIIVVLIGIIFFAKIKAENNYESKLKECNTSTIGYTNRIVGHGKNRNIRYYFYVNNVKYFDEVEPSWEFGNLHKFYNVKYDYKNPENNIIFSENQIFPDSLSLVKAGFTYTKSYFYDNVTSNYKEKWEWK